MLVPAPDGSRIYAGGMFNNVSDERIKKLATLDPVTGAPDAAFRSTRATPSSERTRYPQLWYAYQQQPRQTR